MVGDDKRVLGTFTIQNVNNLPDRSILEVAELKEVFIKQSTGSGKSLKMIQTKPTHRVSSYH